MDQYKEKYMDLLLTTHREVSKETKFFLPNWSDAPKISDFNKEPKKIPATGIEESDILSVGKTLTTPPPGDFVMHKAIAKLFSHRSSLLKQKVVNWSLAEAIAFGSLLKEGVHVRLSGLDVERSMWGNSHYVIHHQAREGTSYTPMDYLDPGQAKFSVHNTPSSQLSVLGFEIGYSQCDPNILVIWEAQDGDYANTAQVMLDEYLACGECKWKKPSGLVVNLPHGRNDMTVEHSSCRPERYLQMCADDVDSVELDYHKQMFNCNWIVTYPTTPANFFHALRRQIVMPFRKPLINILPRVLIAKDESVSPFTDLISDTSYQRIIVENVDPHNVKTVVFCCGKVYYEFDAMRSKQNKHGTITFIRIEQISPFPYDLIMQEIAKYPHAKFVFAQEEPKNMGFHQYCVPRLQNILSNIPLRVVTTPSVAHASCRYPSEHLRQMVEVEKSIVGDPERRPKNQAVFRIDAFHSSVLAFGKSE